MKVDTAHPQEIRVFEEKLIRKNYLEEIEILCYPGRLMGPTGLMGRIGPIVPTRRHLSNAARYFSIMIIPPGTEREAVGVFP